MKLIEKDGKFYRMRRGKLVEIPPEWKGKVLHKQTKMKRKSKSHHRNRSRKKFVDFLVGEVQLDIWYGGV